MKRTFTKYPSSYVKAGSDFKYKPHKYECVGELGSILSKFDDDLLLVLKDTQGEEVFIKNIYEDDSLGCVIELSNNPS